MVVRFNVPKLIGQDSLLVACHLLLFETPLRELDLVREQIATRHDVSQPELRPQRSQTLA